MDALPDLPERERGAPGTDAASEESSESRHGRIVARKAHAGDVSRRQRR